MLKVFETLKDKIEIYYMGVWYSRPESENMLEKSQPTVLIVKLAKDGEQCFLPWKYYALYPENNHAELAALPFLYRSARKLGYTVEFPEKPLYQKIKVYGVQRFWYEMPLFQPLTQNEKKLAMRLDP